MNQTIWKYSISIHSMEILMPAGAKILCVKNQQGYPKYQNMIWALVDPRRNVVPRLIQVSGTGFDNSEIIFGPYIGTVIIDGGTVWHYFDGGEE